MLSGNDLEQVVHVPLPRLEVKPRASETCRSPPYQRVRPKKPVGRGGTYTVQAVNYQAKFSLTVNNLAKRADRVNVTDLLHTNCKHY